MAAHSSILAWEIPWTEGPGGPQGCKVLDMTAHTHPKHKGEGVMEVTRGNDQV